MIRKKAFTLIEVLLVVAIISLLAGIVILAINPSKQLSDTRNAERWVDVNTILSSVYQYAIDHNGAMPANIPLTATGICKSGVLAVNCIADNLVDLSVLTAGSKYVVSIPVDPSGSTDNSVKYTILKTADNRITVSAPNAENSTSISVTR